MCATSIRRRSKHQWQSSAPTFTHSSQDARSKPPGTAMAASSNGAPPVPRHPLPQMQGAFEESMKETLDDSIQNVKNPYLNADKVQRRKLLLESPRYERTVGGRWMQRRGENFHPLWKLIAQISFGMHLLQSGLARSDEEVIRILQSHVDEVDGFLERTTEDFELAQHDITERIKYLRLPLEHGEVFNTMLADKPFRTAIVDGNEKIEHIVNRTTVAKKDALKDVQKGLDGTRELKRFLDELNRKWPTKSHEHEEVLGAMMGNTEGWTDAFKAIQRRGSELGHSLQQLGQVISEIQRRAGVASRRNLPINTPHDQNTAPPSQAVTAQRSANSSHQPSKRTSINPPQLQQLKTSSRGAPKTSPPFMSPIREQEAQHGDKGLRTPASGYQSSGRQSAHIVSPIPPSQPSASNHSSQYLMPVELPGDSRPNHRMSIHQMMTMEALSSSKSSAPASQKSGKLPTVEDQEDQEEKQEDPFNDDQTNMTTDLGRISIETSDKEVVPATEPTEDLKGDVEEGMATSHRHPQVEQMGHAQDPFMDQTDVDKESEAQDPFVKLHNEIINSLAPPQSGQSETISPNPAAHEASKSPQMEGQTFFGYASSDADTGSVDARSTPGKGRSRSTTHSQIQPSHFPKAMSLAEHLDPGQEGLNSLDDEEGVVNHKHPIFQDIRSQNLLSSEAQHELPQAEAPALNVRASSDSLTSDDRKNSFRASDSSVKRLSKPESDSHSPIDVTSNRNSNMTMATPMSLRGTGAEGGLRVRDASQPSSRPRTQVGHAPPIAPHPIQTSGFIKPQENSTGERPSSPSLAELTSATVSGPDAADPFALYSPSNAPKYKHPELIDRLNGALQENERANANNSPTKHGRSVSKTHKKSTSEMQHQLQSQATPPATTMTTTTTTTTYLDPNSPSVTTNYTSGENSHVQTTTTAAMPAYPPSSSHSRSRTLSPFSAGGMMGRNRDRTPEKEASGEGKKGLKKFFSMKKGKKDVPENF